MSAARLDTWERRAEWPLLVLAVAYLVAYAVAVLDTTLSPVHRALLNSVTLGVWVVFGVDYAMRLTLAPRKWAFLRRSWFDLIVLALPLLRQLRVLRVLTVLNTLEGRLRVGFRATVSAYVVGATGLIGFVAALAVLDAERGAPGATIRSFGDAAWWAMTTITTVGYGDTYPVTTAGRFAAAGLMVGGIALLGTVTATLASWFVDRLRDETDAEDAVGDAAHDALAASRHEELLTEIHRLASRVAELESVRR